jgi:selenocysteine lyase/cysteine desulfurase
VCDSEQEYGEGGGVTREAFGAEFDGVDGFLDTATYGVPPRFVAEALRDCVESWQRGSLDVSTFIELMADSRAAYASLTGTDEHRVAIGHSTSSLIGLVAASIPDGSRVATVRGEYTSVTFPFAAQAPRGVTVTELPQGRLEDSAADFDVVAVSLVQSADGTVLDVESLRRSVADAGTVTVIDAVQALGWMDAELSWADAAVGASFKWLLGPRGMAWMSLSDRMSDMLIPHAANPFAAENMWSSLYGLPMRLAGDARRFDSWPAWFSLFGGGMSLRWLAALDRAEVQAHTVRLANLLRTELQLPPLDSAIVSIPGDHSADALHSAGIRAAVRAGAVRVGFHLYNTEADLERLLHALRAC